MKSRLFFHAICIATFPVLFAACSSVPVDSTWKDPEIRAGTFTNIAVRIIDQDAIVRSFLDDQFCAELRVRGIIASKLDLTAALDAKPEDENSPARLAAPGVQAVLIAHQGERPLTQVQSSSGSRLDPYANPDPSRGRRIMDAGRDVERWQCALCLINDMKVIWTTSIDVHIDELSDRAGKLKPFVKASVDQLRRSNLLQPSAR
jgi:hypothetical protein